MHPFIAFRRACQCRYIDFEMKLEELRAVRKQQLGIKGRWLVGAAGGRSVRLPGGGVQDGVERHRNCAV